MIWYANRLYTHTHTHTKFLWNTVCQSRHTNMATNPKHRKKIVWSKYSLYSPIKHHDDGDNDDGYYDHCVGDNDYDDNDDSNV
jgi:hypothetical protein